MCLVIGFNYLAQKSTDQVNLIYRIAEAEQRSSNDISVKLEYSRIMMTLHITSVKREFNCR